MEITINRQNTMEMNQMKTTDHHHRATTMTDLGEDCITTIMSLMTPQDACRLSMVSRDFISAGESDVVWDKFVPPDTINVIVSHSDSAARAVAAAKSKKELYLSLCDHPVLIRDRKMSFSLDKWSGKKSYMISARALRTASEWDKWICLPKSRFGEAPELLHHWLIEIRGRIETGMLSPSTKYNAYLVYKRTANSFRHHSSIWEGPVLVTVAKRDYGSDYPALWETREEVAKKKNVLLALQRELKSHSQETNEAEFPSERSDGWLEILLGEFDCGEHENGVLEMTVREDDSLREGLLVQGIEVRPKRN